MQPGGALDFPALASLIDFHVGQRHVGDRHRRHDRRVADRQRRRALPADPGGDRSRGRAHSGHRRHRRQLDGRSDRADAVREGRRRGRVPVGRPVLQQADAGRDVPAFPHDRRSGRPADGAVQRAEPHGRRSRERDGAAARGNSGHRRDEGCDVRPRRAWSTCATGCRRRASSRCIRATTTPRSPFMLLGGDGVISVTANVAPRADVARCARPRSPAMS